MLRPALLARAAFLVVAAGVAAPATASAADVSIPGKCYVSYPGSTLLESYAESIPVEIDDLPAGQQVRLTLEVKGVQTSSSPLLTAGKRGSLITSLDTWVTGLGDGPTKGTDAKIVVRDYWLGTEFGSATLKVANVAGLMDFELLSAATKRRWWISGLSEVSKRSAYYAHYFVNGKQTTRQYLGKTQDECGFLRVKRVTYPGPPSQMPDKFELRIQASPTFKKSEPYIPYEFVKVTSSTPQLPST